MMRGNDHRFDQTLDDRVWRRPFHLRAACDEDAPAVIALIERCFSDYPGCVIDLPGLDADLPRVASHFAARQGRFWVAERMDAKEAAVAAGKGRIVGCIGHVPLEEPGLFELKRLYVHPSARRMGLASLLAERIERTVSDLGGREIRLWSDTRFRKAHAFYLARGYFRTGRTRELHDPSNTTEYEFVKYLEDQPTDS
ncbi:MAG: GNAT family N-acetyltransferase [Alphaproteobacteria bacterium]|nr:MAG: GNAT family N-acetyltransferase [Alphaproteobacteria bacterium]